MDLEPAYPAPASASCDTALLALDAAREALRNSEVSEQDVDERAGAGARTPPHPALPPLTYAQAGTYNAVYLRMVRGQVLNAAPRGHRLAYTLWRKVCSRPCERAVIFTTGQCGLGRVAGQCGFHTRGR